MLSYLKQQFSWIRLALLLLFVAAFFFIIANVFPDYVLPWNVLLALSKCNTNFAFFKFLNLKLFLSDMLYTSLPAQTELFNVCMYYIRILCGIHCYSIYLWYVPSVPRCPFSKPFAKEEHSNFWISSERPFSIFLHPVLFKALKIIALISTV